MRRRLLIVSFYFPPYGEVGSQRVAKFAKYLKRLGWEITVLTVNEKYYKNVNWDSLEDVAGIKVIRTDIITPFAGIKEFGVFWIPALYRQMKKLQKKEGFEISLWTGNPFYQMILAPLFKNNMGLKYIVDLRDPWRLNPYGKEGGFSLKKIKFILDKFLASVFEPLILKGAEKIINVTAEASEMYRNFYKEVDGDKFVTIFNGYDPEDFKNIKPVSFSKFDIVYSGKFGSFRNPGPFLGALDKFIKGRRLTPQDISFVWIGSPENMVLEMIENLSLKKFVRLAGFKPYKENLSVIKGAALCLLLSGDHAYEPTTKVFDYMGFNKHILGILGAKGFLSGLLEKYEKSHITNNNEEDILNAIINRYDLFATECNHSLAGKYSVSGEFNRVAAAENLNGILLECLKLN